MNVYAFERPKSDALPSWCAHDVTKNLRKQFDHAGDIALERLLSICYVSSDPAVVRAVTEYQAILDVKRLLEMPKGAEGD